MRPVSSRSIHACSRIARGARANRRRDRPPGGGAARVAGLSARWTSIRPSPATTLGRSSGSIGSCGSASTADLRAALKKTAPDVVLLCTSSALKAVAPQIETILKARKADRLDDRGAGLPVVQPAPAGRRHRRCGETGKGRGARHWREPRLRHGRPACHIDRRVRARGPDHHQPHPGRAHPAAALPAEDRVGPHARAVRRSGCNSGRCGTSASPSRLR